MNTNSKLLAVYNGSETIAASGFTMQSNYILPVLARMVKEKIIPQKAMDVVQAIFSFKHSEEKPYPTFPTIARYLGKGESYVKQAVASIKQAGILIVSKVKDETGKESRNNEYDFTPFFALLEKFIVEFKEKKNYDVKIADLMNVKVQKKEEKDFSWTEEYKGKEKAVVPAEEPVQEEAEEEVETVELPEIIKKALKLHNISAEGVQAVEKAYTLYHGIVHDKIFMDKIMASVRKKDFAKYFTTCINTAYTTGEQPKSAAKQEQNKTTGKKPIRTELLPDWFDEMGKPKKEQAPKKEIEKLTAEELAELKEYYTDYINTNSDNESAKEQLKLIVEREEALKQTAIKKAQLQEKLRKLREA